MVAFPLIATLISLICAGIAGRRYWARRRPHELAWSIAFGFFALGAGAAVVGYLAGWTPFLVRLFYASGAILTTGFLGLGSLYILLGRRLDRWGPGLMLILTALGFAFVFNTPVDATRLDEAWYALEREGSPTRLLAVITNSIGSAIVIGGALYSVSVGLRRGMPRERAFGLLLIAGGTLVVASGSSLIKLFGDSSYLFVAMAPGVAIIMLGYLRANRAGQLAPAPATPRTPPAGAEPAPLDATTAIAPPALGWPDRGRAGANGHDQQPGAAPALQSHAEPATKPVTAPPAGLRIRPLTAADAAAVRAILDCAGASSASPLASGIRYLGDDVLAALLADPAATWLGADLAGRTVALARLTPGAEPATRHTARLDPFMVHPDLTGRGIGSALLDEVLRWADQTMGLARLDLWISPAEDGGEERAARFYIRHGFQPEGTLRHALFTGGRHHAVLLLARSRD